MAVLFALVLTGCKVDLRLEVRVAEDGSGRVVARFVLDRAAVDAIGGDVGEKLRVADLEQARWAVDVTRTDEGGAEVVAEKRFARPEELPAVIEQLSGDEGPFQGFSLTRERSTFRTSFVFAGRVDLESGIGASSLDPDDAGVAAEIVEEGIEVEQLREFLKERVDPAFSVAVVVDMPGGGSHNAPKQSESAPQWAPQLGEVTELRAEASDFALDRAMLVGSGVALGLASLAAFARWWRVSRRRSLPPSSRRVMPPGV